MDKIIKKYIEKFGYKAALIPFGYTTFEPAIESEEDLYNAYKTCIEKGKKWEKLYKIIETEGIEPVSNFV